MIFVCPYCYNSLFDLYCSNCEVYYKKENNIYHFYNEHHPHWQRINTIWENLGKQQKVDLNISNVIEIGYPYNTDTYDANAHSGMVNILFELLFPCYNNKTITEIGCGVGWLSSLLARHSQIIAVEVNYRLLSGIDDKYNVVKICADGEKLPLLDNSVDAVVFFNSFHHIYNKLAGLNEIYRILKSGGVLLAIGEIPTVPPYLMNIGEYGYTYDEIKEVFKKSNFTNISYQGIRYCENMQYMSCDQLFVNSNHNNGSIIGYK